MSQLVGTPERIRPDLGARTRRFNPTFLAVGGRYVAPPGLSKCRTDPGGFFTQEAGMTYDQWLCRLDGFDDADDEEGDPPEADAGEQQERREDYQADYKYEGPP